MIPPLGEVLLGYRFIARRHGGGEPNTGDAKAALKLAQTVARGREAHEPAAIIYSFTICRGAFPKIWREMALGFARNHALGQGRVLRIPEDHVDDLFSSIATGEVSYNEVRMWLAEYLMPHEEPGQGRGERRER